MSKVAQKKLVDFRGRKVIAGWPEKLEEAQTVTHYTIDGKSYPRLRFGEESFNWTTTSPCRDCGAFEGELHVQGGDKEQCPKCHEQAFGCKCAKTNQCIH